jgi:protein-S-isoprenylcysteine O-methyltransferase Ste14
MEKTMTGMADLKRRAWLQTVLFAPALAALLIVPAGTLRFWQGWLYGFVFIAATTVIGLYFLKHDPKLVERRMKAGPTAEQEPAQKIIISIISIGFLLLMIVPGLDYRWHWSAVPPWLVLVADGMVVLSFAIMFLVLKQNSYAASTIQVEADQPVVSSGTYAIVRHPMYAGALLLVIFTPLALGSYWTLLVLIPTFPVLAWRLLDEERFLKLNLPGYADYCRQVRYRLIPGIW